MKQIRLIMMVGLTLATAFGDWILFDELDLVIPDNEPMGVQNTQTLSGFTDVIESIEVRLQLSAAPNNLAWNGDFYVTLQHDTGFAVLLNRVGRTDSSSLGYSDNGFDIIFTLGGNDIHLYQADTPSFDGSGRLTGTWGVDGRNIDPDLVLDTSPRTDMLDNFSGLDPNGSWTLFIADMNPNGVAVLEEWGLYVVVVPELGTLSLLLVVGGVLALTCRRRRRC